MGEELPAERRKASTVVVLLMGRAARGLGLRGSVRSTGGHEDHGAEGLVRKRMVPGEEEVGGA